MTWTYNLTNMTSSSSGAIRNRIRTLVGDTSSGYQLLQDEQVDVAVGSYGWSEYYAAAVCCDMIASSFGTQVWVRNGELLVRAEERTKAFREQAKSFRRLGRLGGQAYVGGRSYSEKDAAAADTTLTQPYFKRGMDDYTAPGPTSSTS